jgi:hypothetical protein
MSSRWGAFGAVALAALLAGGCAGSIAADGGGPQVGSDPMALCRENMTEPSSATKVGPLRLLNSATAFGPNKWRGSSQKPVPWSNVRMYAAQLQGVSSSLAAQLQGSAGKRIDWHEVCFLEKMGKNYRFVQTCWADAQLARIDGCDIGWITGQPAVGD